MAKTAISRIMHSRKPIFFYFINNFYIFNMSKDKKKEAIIYRPTNGM